MLVLVRMVFTAVQTNVTEAGKKLNRSLGGSWWGRKSCNYTTRCTSPSLLLAFCKFWGV